MPEPTPDQRLAKLAAQQMQVVTRSDLLDCGFSDDQIAHRVDQGHLARVHRAVYRTPGSPTPEQLALAACLACGRDAVCSHRTAGAIWGLAKDTGPPAVTVPMDRRLRHDGIMVHRTRRWHRRDRTRFGIIPLTTPARTLMDLASVLSEEEVARAADAVFLAKRSDPERLLDYLEEQPSHLKGIDVLRRIVADRAGQGVPESELERLALALIRRSGLPKPVRQHSVRSGGRPYRLDLAYPDRRVAIELEGRGPHLERWQADHERHNALELAGWRVLYFTWEDVTEHPVRVAVAIAEALGLEPVRWVSAR